MNKKRNNRNPRQLRSQQVRIIGGLWRRTPLPVLEMEGLRPTPDRVRETVFNWINHLWHGQWDGKACLDMFAGTGAFGFEAASRGAQQVTLIESGFQVCRQLEAIKHKLKAEQVQVVCGSALDIAQGMASRGLRYDLIIVDPPYEQGLLLQSLALCASLVGGNGLVYMESAQPIEAVLSEKEANMQQNWQIIRAGRAGIVHYALLEPLK